MKKIQLGISLLILGALAIFVFKPSLEQITGSSSVLEAISNPGTIFDVTTDGTATSSPYTLTVPWSGMGWRGGSFMFENMANATVTIFATNDKMASSSVLAFTDITTDIIAASNFSANRPVFINDNIVATYLRFRVTTSTSDQSSVRIKAIYSTK